MGRNLFSTEEILKLPVTTNKLSVTWDSGALFKKYSIVSYSMKAGIRIVRIYLMSSSLTPLPYL